MTAPPLVERWVLSVRLAAWRARQVLPFTLDPGSAEAAIVAAEAWADCPRDTHAADAAAAETTTRGDYSDAAVAATITARIIGHVTDLRFPGEAARPHETQAHEPATAPAKEEEALSAATEAVHAAACAATGDVAKVALLTGLLVKHARLTGRVLPGPMSRADTDRLAAATDTPAHPHRRVRGDRSSLG